MRGKFRRRWGWKLASVCSVAVVPLLLGARAQSGNGGPVPYASIATEGESYAGPGRDTINDLTEPVIHIGLLVPLHGAEKPDGDAMVSAAQMALQDSGGDVLPRGRRIALDIRDESGPSWGIVSDTVIHLILDDDAVAVITSTSGTDAHLTEQVGNRIGVPVLTLSADLTTTQIDIPWIFRMGASDVAEARVIAQRIYRDKGLKTVLLITEQDHDGRRGIEAMEQAAGELGGGPPDSVAMDPLRMDVGPVMKRIQAASPQAVVIWTGAETAGILLHALQGARVKTACFLSQQAAQAGSGMTNTTEGGPSVPEVWTVAADGEDAAVRQSFTQRYKQATGISPSAVAAETYDAVAVTLRAMRIAGANRARVRDALAGVQNFNGASGRISFDREGNDRTAFHLVRMTEVHE